MPWKRVTPMTERKAFLEEALQNDINFSQLCQKYGISRKTGYKWFGRAQEEGTLELPDRSRRPNTSPNQVSPEIEHKVLEIRAEHPAWGGRKIRRILCDQELQGVPAISTITMILKRNRMIDPLKALEHKAFQRFEHEHPNDLWQMDYKGSFRLLEGGLCQPLTVLDDHSRFLLGLRACPNQRGITVQKQLTAIFEEYGLPKRMLMDNGSPWGDDLDSRYTKLTTWLLRLGVSISHGRPYHPQTQGKDERLHRTLQEELLIRTSFSNLLEAQKGFDDWRYVYNFVRPHEALSMEVPASRYQASLNPFPTVLPEMIYPAGDAIRKTDERGAFFFRGKRFRIGKAFPAVYIGLRETDRDGVFDVYYYQQRVARIDLFDAEP